MSKSFAPARSQKPRRKTWCGPYAIAVAIKADYDEAYEQAVRILGRPITGMYTSQLRRVLTRLGVDHSHLQTGRYERLCYDAGGYKIRGTRWVRPTLTQWLRDAKEQGLLADGALAIVELTTHYVCVRRTGSHYRIIDNGQPEWQAPSVRKGTRSYKRARVDSVTVIENWEAR